MRDRYVCTPCKIIPDEFADSAMTLTTNGTSVTCTSLDDAKCNASKKWQTGLYDIVLVSKVDDLANVSIIGIVGYYQLSSRYDLPLKVAETDRTLPRLARIIRDYAERDCPVLEEV